MNNQLTIEEFYSTHSIDPNFNADYYLAIYPEVKDFYQPYCKNADIDDEARIYYHYYYYNKSDILETNTELLNIEKFYINHKVDDDFDEIKYLEHSPAAIDYYQPWANENRISENRRLFHHCFIYQISRDEIEVLEADSDFNENFYEQIFPEVIKYCSFWTKLDKKKKLFHHYLKYNKNLNEISNFYLKTSNIIDEAFDEKKYIDHHPEAENYCQPWAKDHNISDRQRLFHHSLICGYKKKPINQLDIKTKNSIISINSNEIKWQSPAYTEKFYFYNHAFIDAKIKEYYVSFPWATFIDKHMFLDDKHLGKIKNITSTKEGKKHTICQHIRWRQLIDLWEEIGITDVHLSHYEKDTKDTDRIKFHSWALVAANYENKDRSMDLKVKANKSKKYLASFIGAYKESYRNTIRLDLKNILEKEKQVIYEVKDEWFYEKIVFGHQVKNEKLPNEYLESYEKETQRYNSILSDSIFSLCPEGTGPNTIRLWESMAIGVIPVIFSDDWIPPKITELEWNDFAVFIKNKDIKDTISILRSFSEDKLEIMKLNCINAYKYFRQMDCFTTN